MTLDYSITAFNALNISVLMTIPIGSISIVLLIRSLFLSRRMQFITSALVHLKNRRATKEINLHGIKITM